MLFNLFWTVRDKKGNRHEISEKCNPVVHKSLACLLNSVNCRIQGVCPEDVIGLRIEQAESFAGLLGFPELGRLSHSINKAIAEVAPDGVDKEQWAREYCAAEIKEERVYISVGNKSLFVFPLIDNEG